LVSFHHRAGSSGGPVSVSGKSIGSRFVGEAIEGVRFNQ
jgi:hypothetical protein